MSSEFAGTLNERILIEAPVATRTAAGLQEFGWVAVCRCLAAVVAEGVGPEAEAMALSAMPRFRVTIRKRDGIAIDQRLSWKGGKMMIRQLLHDPKARDRITLRCEEVRGP